MKTAEVLDQAVAVLRDEFRRRKGIMSYGEMAAAIGVHAVTLSHFNKGGKVGTETLEKIAAWIDQTSLPR